MKTAFNAFAASSQANVSRVIGLGSALVGVLVLIGWAFHIEQVKSLFVAWPAMETTTALSFMLIGLVLWLSVIESADWRLLVLRYGGAATVALLGLLTLSQDLIGWDPVASLCTAFIQDNMTVCPGLMAPTSAFNFLLLGITLLLLDYDRSWVFQSTITIIIFTATLALISYLYDPQNWSTLNLYKEMPPLSAIVFLFSCCGLFCARADKGFMTVFLSNNVGGMTARRLLPAVVLIPFALGGLRILGEQANFYDAKFGVALLVTANITVLVILIGWNAFSIWRLDGERVRSEEALKVSEERFRLLVENAHDYAIYLLDAAGRIIIWNQGAERLLGYRSEEILGRHFFSFFSQEEQAQGQPTEELQVVMAEGWLETEGWRVRKDGSRFWANETMTRLDDERGACRGFAHIMRDMSERKQAEETLRQTVQDLTRSNADLEQFAYVASHDLQEPLRAVSGCVQMLGQRYRDKLDERAGELIRHAVEGATRMQTLINDLLAYSRVGTHGGVFTPVDCATVLERVRENLATTIQESGAVIHDGALPTVMADQTQLMQLLQNLIGNALKYRNDQPPLVIVTAERRAGEWVFSVRDNGIGIEPQYAERIFGVFQRLHTRREYPGTGIGLAICKKIVERHGGRIWVESTIGQGATFFFTLPEKGRQENGYEHRDQTDQNLTG